MPKLKLDQIRVQNQRSSGSRYDILNDKEIMRLDDKNPKDNNHGLIINFNQEVALKHMSKQVHIKPRQKNSKENANPNMNWDEKIDEGVNLVSIELKHSNLEGFIKRKDKI